MKSQIKYYVLAALFLGYFACKNAPDLGYFEGNGDIGPVKQAGSLQYSPADSSYAVSGSGTNMWFDTDEFHFVWKKMSGNVSLAADIEWISEGGIPIERHVLSFGRAWNRIRPMPMPLFMGTDSPPSNTGKLRAAPPGKYNPILPGQNGFELRKKGTTYR